MSPQQIDTEGWEHRWRHTDTKEEMGNNGRKKKSKCDWDHLVWGQTVFHFSGDSKDITVSEHRAIAGMAQNHPEKGYAILCSLFKRAGKLWLPWKKVFIKTLRTYKSSRNLTYEKIIFVYKAVSLMSQEGHLNVRGSSSLESLGIGWLWVLLVSSMVFLDRDHCFS